MCSGKYPEPNESGSLEAWCPPGPRVCQFCLHSQPSITESKERRGPILCYTRSSSPHPKPDRHTLRCSRTRGNLASELVVVLQRSSFSLSLSRAKTHISPNPIPHHLTNIGCIYWLCSIPQQPLHFKTACSPTKGNVLFIWCLLTDHFHAQRKVKAQPGREDEMTAEILK